MVKKFPDFFFSTGRVILRSEEYCSDEIPKFLTRNKCVFTWQLEHSCVAIDLVCFNLFMFLVGYVLYSLHVCVCGCVRYDNCVWRFLLFLADL